MFHVKLYSTNSPAEIVSFEDAVFQSLPKDGGLYLPTVIPTLPSEFWESLADKDLVDIASEVTKALIGDVLPADRIERLVKGAITFPSPLKALYGRAPKQYILELFHGPTMAFKDFGARFMAAVMEELLIAKEDRLHILVATSGDTGGAVAAGFQGSDRIDVTILYPCGGVSDIQEAQLTTLGGNITALRVNGTFDDCQHLVKLAFVDHELRSKLRISSANSINILRLIPQTFYYIDGYRQWQRLGHSTDPVFAVPSGNFGNLTAGIIASQMGLPVRHFVAATNSNDTVVRYADSGQYETRRSIKTLSNAMDVGAPSNFPRLEKLLGSTWNTFKQHIYAASFDDKRTELEMAEVCSSADTEEGTDPYILDPHAAVGALALRKYQTEVEAVPGIVLGTAHPGKFRDDVERILGRKMELPQRLEEVRMMPRVVTDIPNDYAHFRALLLETER